MDLTIKMLPGECWWGGAVEHGSQMPLTEQSEYALDARVNPTANQFNGVFLSSEGRYIVFAGGGTVRAAGGELRIGDTEGEIFSGKAGNTLKEAHKYVAEHFYQKPAALFPAAYMTEPQYCTWVETLVDVTQEKLLAYAESIRGNGLSGRLLIVDDGWMKDYGDWRFDERKIPDAKGTIGKLKELGFDVVLWCVPFVNEGCPDFPYLKGAGALVTDGKGELVIDEWWNGKSAVLDLSKPAAREWFGAKLEALVRDYGVAGFKFDAGGPVFYPKDGAVSPNEQSRLWSEFGTKYGYVELRECVGLGGAAIAQRLCDKPLNWKRGLSVLAPDIIQCGLLGYYYCCADMVGGGNISDYADLKNFDEEFYLRSCQCAALFPMIQFSYALWRRTDALKRAVRSVCELRRSLQPYFEELIEGARTRGEPIVRNLEYEFPHQGLAEVKDVFLLGSKYLVSPVVCGGERCKKIVLPQGTRWRYLPDGSIYEGEADVACDLETLPVFERV